MKNPGVPPGVTGALERQHRAEVETWAPAKTPTSFVTLGTLLCLSFLICRVGVLKAPAHKVKSK